MKYFHPLWALLFPFCLMATEKWGVYEIELDGPKVENPFTEVMVSAEFRFGSRTYQVDGFYDGDQTYRIRFMPDEEGDWAYRVRSNRPEMDGKSGRFTCTPAKKGNHGPVRVTNTFHFGYADGTPFYPLGTTAYAWVHQTADLREATLRTLESQAFNKLRMTVMPKYYGRYVSDEPPFYPFEGSMASGWERTKFNIEFFRNLEDQIAALGRLGIQADLILFHPYDKEEWGFDQGSMTENVLYLKYVVARIAAFRNVWWSMANEYDLMEKPESEWDLYFKTLVASDPYGHLKSIHNGKAWYDHTKPWITHLSVQTPFLEHTQAWRATYGKPVINDEFVYEGNIPFDWGNLTAEETVHRFWTIYCRGGYASHGETYVHPENILWWAKGGTLHGKSPERLKFLQRVMKEAPRPDLMPFESPWNKSTYLFKGEEYYLHYYGNTQQASAILILPEDEHYLLEVLDVWNMTIDTLEGTYRGVTEIPLPERPYMAIRVRKQ